MIPEGIQILILSIMEITRITADGTARADHLWRANVDGIRRQILTIMAVTRIVYPSSSAEKQVLTTMAVTRTSRARTTATSSTTDEGINKTNRIRQG